MEPTQQQADTPEPKVSRDAANWSKTVTHLQSGEVPAGAMNLNVDGRRLAGPLQGFGKLWQKTYRMTLPAGSVSPVELIAEWKAHFGEFWPKGHRFYGPLTALNPGDVAVLNLKAGPGVKLSTGIFVMYADETSFTFMDAEGHQFSAWITFSAEEGADGGTLVQIQPLLRTSDPLYEMGWPLMSRIEDRFWEKTLRNLAAHFGVEDVDVARTAVCVDRKRQWKNWRNVKHNAGIRSVLYQLGAPFRAIAKPFRRRAKASG